MAGIRVASGEKKIEVNDDGGYIVLNLNDNDFLNRFFGMYERIQQLADESTERENDARAKYAESGKDGEANLVKEILSLYLDAGNVLKKEVDDLFGAGTCQKVFGDITPTFDLYLDFFEQLTPFLREFAQEKSARMSKYSANRTGNV